MKLQRFVFLAVTAASSVFLSAAPISGTVDAAFTNIVLAGNLIDTDETLDFFDNSATAVFSGVNTNELTFGSFPDPAQPIPESTILFVGNPFTVEPGEEFLLGSLFFTNGTSDTPTVIFGATLNLFGILDGGGQATSAPLLFDIGTTRNVEGGTPERNSDFLFFPSLGISFNVVEGGTGQFDIFGALSVDGQVTTIDVRRVLEPVPNDGGFLDDGVADSQIPEPSTFALAGLALAIPVLARKRR